MAEKQETEREKARRLGCTVTQLRAANRQGLSVKAYLAQKQERKGRREQAKAAKAAAQEARAKLREAEAQAIDADTGEEDLDTLADRVLRQQLLAAGVRAEAGAPGPEDAALARTLAGRRVTQRQQISGPDGGPVRLVID